MELGGCGETAADADVFFFELGGDSFYCFTDFVHGSVGVGKEEDIFVCLGVVVRDKVFDHDGGFSGSGGSPEKEVVFGEDDFLEDLGLFDC